LTRQIGRQYGLYWTAGIGYDLNPGTQQHDFQGAGDGPANQDVDPQFQQMPTACRQVKIFKRQLLKRSRSGGVGVAQYKLTGHVEYRRDPTTVNGKCDFHAS
jgi:hypothetical protein